MKILIIDNGRCEVQSLIDLLEDESHDITLCTSINELKCLERFDFDIAITEVILFQRDCKFSEIENYDYDYLRAGIKYAIPILKKEHVPIIIYTGVPKALFSELPEYVDEYEWLDKSDFLPSMMLKMLEKIKNIPPHKSID